MNNGHRTSQVLIVTDVLGGGTGNHLLSITKYWDKSRWNTTISSYAKRTARIAPDVPIEIASPLRGLSMYPFGQLRRLWQLKNRIKQISPDIVHTYFFWPIIYGRVLKQLGVIQHLIENREDQGFGWSRQDYALLRLTGALPDRVICVSNAVREIVIENERLDPERVVVIHNGIDPINKDRADRLAARAELGLNHNHLVVGMVANFNRLVKGVSLFLDAVPAIVRAVPTARFIILGRGQEEGALRERAKALGIDSYVVFAGYREDVGRYYPTMDVSVLTSLSEGLSITLLESMNYGIPVVVTRVGGNPEVIVDGIEGYLVPPRDIHAFAEKVIQLLKDPALRKRMGAAARIRVNNKFRLEEVASRYIEVYSNVLNDLKRTAFF